jgi:hypothetical protein
MGAMLFKYMVSENQQINRVFGKLKEISGVVTASPTPQLISGTAVSSELTLRAALSETNCVYYKVEAFELSDENDKLDWRVRFTEENAVAFTLNGILIDAGAQPSIIRHKGDVKIEIHTGEDAFPIADFGEEPELTHEHYERVMIFEHNTNADSTGVIKDEMPNVLRDLLLRNEFDLYSAPGNMQHKRMKFIETTIDMGRKVMCIGIVTASGDTNKLILEPV